MAAVDDLIRTYPVDPTKQNEWKVQCTLCGHETVWRRSWEPFVPGRLSRNARESVGARLRIVGHIRSAHQDVYAASLDRDREHRKQRAEWRVKQARIEVNKTPYQRGQEAACMHLAAIERYNAAPPDSCPYKKGTPEEDEYDRGWKTAMKHS